MAGKNNLPNPRLLFADQQGKIYDHPELKMLGCSGWVMKRPDREFLVPMPEMTRLYYHPGCPPYGWDPEKKRAVLLRTINIDGNTICCNAVSAFVKQGWVRLFLPAMDYSEKNYTLPLWAYSTVGYEDGKYYVPVFNIDDNYRWDPEYFDDQTLLPEVKKRLQEFPDNRVVRHLERCACEYHCFAAKNFFYRRWEAPVPTSPACNSKCLGCISLQPDSGCLAPQERIGFVPTLEEIVPPFVRHMEEAGDAIVSFGQGCEGEPLLQWKLISDAIRDIRSETMKGTINLNTNGSVPERVAAICKSGLDSIRISINSARKELYEKYYRPEGYCFEDVLASIKVARELGVFTMINYLIFPGITDQKSELDAMCKVIEHTRPHMIHFKNLNIDPQFYLSSMGSTREAGMGIERVKEAIEKRFPFLQFGYYNRTRENFTIIQ